ncbi:DMT family transporter [Alkanindiges sp. WGS2144]|uniref:DMT family transporter n=1 Tax=Alkanindiges sp. WGS2144 TaxID=3366808 RepID=UPI0037504AB4
MSSEQPPQMLRLPASTDLSPAATATDIRDASQWQVGSRYILLVLIWSSTPLAVVWSVRDLHPVWALTARFVLAAVLAYGVCRVIRLTVPSHKLALKSYVAGSLSLLGAMLLTYLAAPYLASGLISLLFGFAPIMAGLMAFLFKQDQTLFGEQWLGMLVALLGLTLICLTGESAFVQPVGVALILLAVACYVGSMFWVKHLKANLNPLAQTTGSLMVSAVGILLLLPLFWKEAPAHIPSGLTIMAILYSVVVASIIAMLCYFDLVQRLRPSTVALTTVLTPVFALMLGALLNHERIGANMILGVGVILLGLVLYFVRDWALAYLKKSNESR